MATDLVIRQNDTEPAFLAVVQDPSGNPINLAGAESVTFVMRKLSSATPTVNAAMSVVKAATGQVSYSWATADTKAAGLYMAEIHVTDSGGGTYTYPNTGFLQIEVTESLTNPSQQLVSVSDVKDVLNMADLDRVHDTKILRWINAARPLIEREAGPIIPQQFEEWHDGGSYQIVLRHRPSNGLGTSPILIVNFISEYNGPIEWPLALVSSPDEGVLYSAQVEYQTGRIVRRTAGGGVQSFPTMPQSVHVWYWAGQNVVPDNVYEATLEYLRIRYQKSAQALRSGRARAEDIPDTPLGFALPRSVKEMLGVNRRAPSIA